MRPLTAAAPAAALICAAVLNVVSSPPEAAARSAAQAAPSRPQAMPAPGKPQPAVVRIQKLPPALRERARAVLAETDETARADAAEELIKTDPVATLDFALALLEDDVSPVVRAEILDELEKDRDPRIIPALEGRLLKDPDPKIAIGALEVLRRRATLPLLELLERRMAAVRAAGDMAQLRTLAEEHERWATVVRGGLLPTFMQQPPPIFAAAPAGWPVRVLAFGDFGDGSEADGRRGDADVSRAAAVRLRGDPRRQLLLDRHGQP